MALIKNNQWSVCGFDLNACALIDSSQCVRRECLPLCVLHQLKVINSQLKKCSVNGFPFQIKRFFKAIFKIIKRFVKSYDLNNYVEHFFLLLGSSNVFCNLSQFSTIIIRNLNGFSLNDCYTLYRLIMIH